jgi:3-phosphoshikimate 1-carboxyvinyltransferase
MPLPDSILLHPIERPKKTSIGIPGSKSITNRALVLAAISEETTTLKGALWSEDTQVMVECLERLGVDILILPEASDDANRRIRVRGTGGRIRPGGTLQEPLELFVGNAGTAARFILALVCLGQGFYRISGEERMHQRPQQELVAALRALGYLIETGTDRLPAMVQGQGPKPGAACVVSTEESSQFASALWLAAEPGGWDIKMHEEDASNVPYVEMTRSMLQSFPKGKHSDYQIEPDASGGSYFWAIKYLMGASNPEALEYIEIPSWPRTRWQVDTAFPNFWPLPARVSRETDLGDSIMTSIIMAPWAEKPTTFTNLGRLRVQECERVRALHDELTKCGARLEESGNTLVVYPGPLHGAEIHTYNDHRIAMCFAVIASQVGGMVLQNPACVKKTFPNFFQKLGSSAPEGLGMKICDAASGNPLQAGDLIA